MGSQPVILVADDDENDAFLGRAFETAKVSCRLEVVRNGQEVIDYLKGERAYADRAARPWPALMLLDLKMPVRGATAYQVKPGNFDYLLAVARELGDRWLTRQDGSAAERIATGIGGDNR